MTNERTPTLNFQSNVRMSMSALSILCACVIPAWSEHPKKAPPVIIATRAQTRRSAERGLAFLVEDASKWRTERKCSSCHHGTMTVWALSEAKSQGFAVDTQTFVDNVKWAKERLEGIDKPRDTRAGWSMINTNALYLAVMARANPKQDALSPVELKQIEGHLIRHQEPDGSWAWSSAPVQNRPPPVFESDEVATLLGCMVMRSSDKTVERQSSEERQSLVHAAAWLAKNEANDTAQAEAFRLLKKVWDGKRGRDLNTAVKEFRKLQRVDGGWGQVKDAPSDAYATGQALYVLRLAGMKSADKVIQRGVAFLIGNQKEDGSWPMKSRCHPGAKPMTNPVPITYFGSAWATLGLMRSAGR
jgi:hypothetical protein